MKQRSNEDQVSRTTEKWWTAERLLWPKQNQKTWKLQLQSKAPKARIPDRWGKRKRERGVRIDLTLKGTPETSALTTASHSRILAAAKPTLAPSQAGAKRKYSYSMYWSIKNLANILLTAFQHISFFSQPFGLFVSISAWKGKSGTDSPFFS